VNVDAMNGKVGEDTKESAAEEEEGKAKEKR